MTRKFVVLPEFDKNWKNMGLNDNDLRRLQEELLLDPTKGDLMQRTGGLRKLRFAFEGKGKSGSGRVCYVDFAVYETLYLITAYPKNEKDNLSKSERNSIAKMIKVLESALSIRSDHMNVFESIMTGLNEAVEYEKGKGKARTVQLTVAPVPDFSAEEIKALRQALKMTQGTFAALMGVSSKTVEAWEAGTNIPLGTARRMLGLLKEDNSIPSKYNLVG